MHLFALMATSVRPAAGTEIDDVLLWRKEMRQAAADFIARRAGRFGRRRGRLMLVDLKRGKARRSGVTADAREHAAFNLGCDRNNGRLLHDRGDVRSSEADVQCLEEAQPEAARRSVGAGAQKRFCNAVAIIR